MFCFVFSLFTFSAPLRMDFYLLWKSGHNAEQCSCAEKEGKRSEVFISHDFLRQVLTTLPRSGFSLGSRVLSQPRGSSRQEAQQTEVKFVHGCYLINLVMTEGYFLRLTCIFAVLVSTQDKRLLFINNCYKAILAL